MAMTRMQPAIPITVIDRIARLAARRSSGTRTACGAVRPRCLRFSSAARPGRWRSLATRAATVRKALAARLGLADVPQWHSQRDKLAEFAGLAVAGHRQPRQIRPGCRADGARRRRRSSLPAAAARRRCRTSRTR